MRLHLSLGIFALLLGVLLYSYQIPLNLYSSPDPSNNNAERDEMGSNLAESIGESGNARGLQLVKILEDDEGNEIIDRSGNPMAVHCPNRGQPIDNYWPPRFNNWPPRFYQGSPDGFVQKHFCWWCKDDYDALMLTKQRKRWFDRYHPTMKGGRDVNIVIVDPDLKIHFSRQQGRRVPTYPYLDWEVAVYNAKVRDGAGNPVIENGVGKTEREYHCYHKKWLRVLKCRALSGNHQIVPGEMCINVCEYGKARTYHEPLKNGHLSSFHQCRRLVNNHGRNLQEKNDRIFLMGQILNGTNWADYSNKQPLQSISTTEDNEHWITEDFNKYPLFYNEGSYFLDLLFQEGDENQVADAKSETQENTQDTSKLHRSKQDGQSDESESRNPIEDSQNTPPKRIRASRTDEESKDSQNTPDQQSRFRASRTDEESEDSQDSEEDENQVADAQSETQDKSKRHRSKQDGQSDEPESKRPKKQGSKKD